MSQKIFSEQIETAGGFTSNGAITSAGVISSGLVTVDLRNNTASSGRDVTNYIISNDNTMATVLISRPDGNTNVGIRFYGAGSELFSVNQSSINWKGSPIITGSGINAATLDNLDSTQFTRFNAVSNDGYVWIRRNSSGGSPPLTLTQQGTGDIAQFAAGSNAGVTVSRIDRNGSLERFTHENGHLIGSYNTIGANSTKSNPIYTIGRFYNPAEETLNNMYGIGYTNNAASFIPASFSSGWGMYAASNGNATVWLNASSGIINVTNSFRVNNNVVWHTGNDGSGSGLDADTVDGLQGGDLVKLDNRSDGYIWVRRSTTGSTLYVTQQSTGSIAEFRQGTGDGSVRSTIDASGNYITSGYVDASDIRVGKNGGSDSIAYFYDDNSNTYRSFFWDDSANDWSVEDNSGATRKLWHQGNDGSGSGLDADLLDGIDSTRYTRNDAVSIKTSLYTRYNDNTSIYFNTSTGIRLYGDGLSRLRLTTESGAENVAIFAANGACTFYFDNAQKLTTTSGGITVTGSGTATDWIATSDRKLKRNIKPLENSLDKVLRLEGKTFNRIDDEDKEKVHIGLIAQEVEQVVPELVENIQIGEGDDVETVKGVKYEKITALLIESIKEQQKQIDELKEQVKKLSK